MLYIGCHLSSSKGFAAMGRQALELGANTFQFFTRNPRGSRAKDLDPADAAALRDLLAQTLADMEADGTTERIVASFGLNADTALGRTTP